jgi:hypothetical protein
MAFRDIAFRRLEQFRSAQLRITGRESAWNIVDVIGQNDQPEPPDRGPGGRRTDLESAIKTLAAVATLVKIAYGECQIWKARCTSAPAPGASTPVAPTPAAATHVAVHLDETQFLELANATMGEIEIKWPFPKSDLPNDANEIVRETIQDATREIDALEHQRRPARR